MREKRKNKLEQEHFK